MPAFDPRLTPARGDLAAKELEGKVEALRYVEGRGYEVIDPQAPLRNPNTTFFHPRRKHARPNVRSPQYRISKTNGFPNS